MTAVWSNPNASWQDKLGALGSFAGTNANNLFQLAMIFGTDGEGEGIEMGGEGLLREAADLCGGGLSFTASTKVATAKGEQAIGTLHVGDKVWAYNPHTHTMERQPILHVWINHNHDLVDLTLTIISKGSHGHTTITREVLHTNQRHPFLTLENGFVPVSHLRLGMHILRANGSLGIVTGKRLVPGIKTMYNLEVAQDHTFTVGDASIIAVE